MFVSFFPRPKLFFWSAVLWTILAVGLWYAGGRAFGAHLGLPPAVKGADPIVGVQLFWSPAFLWFYIYYAVFVGAFAAFWRSFAPNPWWRWSILGSALILFVTYIQVEVSVAINNWYGPFYDLIQAALSKSAPVTMAQFNGQLLIFLEIALVAVTVGVLTDFFVNHYVFRWRTAMNQYYMAHWDKLRHVEGAAQRVQDDTMRFSKTTEDLGIDFVTAIMTLIAFLPVLMRLSTHVKELPIIGHVPNGLVFAALLWSLFGTMFLAAIGVRLPGLEFRNQRVEAAYRKELVYGEDDPARADLPTVAQIFSGVRRNYFRLYFHYLYFNVGRMLYVQTDNIFPFIILSPTIVAGLITLGLMQQILGALDQVRGSFQILISSWKKIIELASIYKRLRAFEAVIQDEPLPSIETVPG